MQSDVPPLPIACLIGSIRSRRDKSFKAANAGNSRSSPYKDSARPKPAPADKISRRVSSAKMLRMKQLQNQLADAHLHLNELSNENKLLKAIQKRQDAALKRYEGASAELPRIMNSHHEELRVLEAKHKKLRAEHGRLGETLSAKEGELRGLRAQNKRLLQLSEDRQLGQRGKLQAQVLELSHRVSEQDQVIQALKRKLALEGKYLRHQLRAEMAKRRSAQLRVESLEQLHRAGGLAVKPTSLPGEKSEAVRLRESDEGVSTGSRLLHASLVNSSGRLEDSDGQVECGRDSAVTLISKDSLLVKRPDDNDDDVESEIELPVDLNVEEDEDAKRRSDIEEANQPNISSDLSNAPVRKKRVPEENSIDTSLDHLFRESDSIGQQVNESSEQRGKNNDDEDKQSINPDTKAKLLAAFKKIDDNENVEFVDQKVRKNSASQITENLHRGVPVHSKKKDTLMRELFPDSAKDNNNVGKNS